MPEKRTIEKAMRDKREGKSPSTQAGEFVHDEIFSCGQESCADKRRGRSLRLRTQVCSHENWPAPEVILAGECAV